MLKAIFGSKALLGAASAMALGGAAFATVSATAPAAPAAEAATTVEQTGSQQTTQIERVAFSRKDAYLASTDRVILHYGDGLWGVEQIAEILEKRGCPADAYAGGATGQVEMFVGKGKFGPYTQVDINGGELSSDAIVFYQERVGPCGKRTAELNND